MLTPAQKATLKTNIQNTPAANALYLDGNLSGLTDFYNAPSSPSFTVWKTNVSIAEIGDKFNGTELAGLTTGNQSRLQTIGLFSAGGVNASIADRRAFFDDVFSGAGGVNTRAALLALWKRIATRFERVYATGTGSDASPGLIVVAGPLDYTELIGL